MPPQKTIKLSEATWRKLRTMAYERERPMNALLDEAVDLLQARQRAAFLADQIQSQISGSNTLPFT